MKYTGFLRGTGYDTKAILKKAHEFKSEYTTEKLTTMSLEHHTTTVYPNESFLDSGYVEWYWVALGLIVPVLLGSLFCILDHMRRKKGRNTRHTERRLESMCERNKYVPPKYEEIIPNNSIIIEPVPGLSQSPQGSSQPVFTVEVEAQVGAVAPPQPSTAFHGKSSPSLSFSSNDYSVNSSTSLGAEGLHASSMDSSLRDSLDQANFEDNYVESPPSYDEHYKYELYGSHAQLV